MRINVPIVPLYVPNVVNPCVHEIAIAAFVHKTFPKFAYVIVSWTISPLIAWINMLGQEPYGTLSNCGFVRLFAMMLSVTFAIPCTIPVVVELLFQVIHSVLVVVIFAVLTNVDHDVSRLVSVPVRMIVHPLHAGSVQILNVVAGKIIHTGAISVITTPIADLPQLFP